MFGRVAGIVSVCVMLLSIIVAWSRISSPSDGSVVQLSNKPWQGDRMTITFVLDDTTGLRDRDVVTAVNGVQLPGRIHGPNPVKGDAVSYSVIRDGAVQPVTVELRGFPIGGFLTRTWTSLLVLFTLLGIAGFVFYRRPNDPAAQALILMASLTFYGTLSWLFGDQSFRLAASGPSMLDIAGELSLAMIWGALAHFCLVAPGASMVVTRRRLVFAYSLPLLLHGAYLLISLPVADSALEVAGRIAQVSFIPSSVLPLIVSILLVVTYRSIEGVESRRRMRWVLLTLLAGALALLTIWTIPNALNLPVPPETLIALLFLPPTLALGAAILRYRLFDIELILRRSLLYGSLTLGVVGLYLAGAWVLSQLPMLRPGLWAVLVGGLIGLSVAPMRSFLRKRVGRLIYGARDDPFDVVSRLGRIDTAADPQSVLQNVTRTLAQSLRLPFAAIELRRPHSRFALAASYGQSVGAKATLPLASGNDVLGRLVLAVGPGREPFGPADERLLDALTRQVSSAASTVLLANELQQSREQIVLAREEERRRLHHRLHDGLGPNLAASIMQTELALRLIPKDPEAAAGQLDKQIAATRSLISEIRGLVYNLRPPALDQLGLAGALAERAERLAQPSGPNRARMRVLLSEKGRLDDLPAAVEVAAFWIAVEAVSNAVRHAGASSCHIRLTRDASLWLEIRDDGRGISNHVLTGGGWISMRERAEELGGLCEVRAGESGGTVVRARLPIRKAEAT
jgi:two-component system NarL family sensor kinase